MMTEIALVADLHGNWPATEAVDRDIRARGIRRIWCLGDVVGKVIEDKELKSKIARKVLEALTQWPYEHECFISGRKIRLFHGRSIMPAPYYIHEPTELLAPYFLPDYQVVGYADVHRQGLRLLGSSGILFNTGSVGNGFGVAMAQYAILRGVPDSREPAPFDIVMVTVPYDREQAIRDTLEAGKQGMPNADLFEREIRTALYARANGRGKP